MTRPPVRRDPNALTAALMCLLALLVLTALMAATADRVQVSPTTHTEETK